MHPFLMSAGLLGLLSVVFGAFSEHALRPNVDAESFRFLMTAVRYNQVHAVALLALALGLALVSVSTLPSCWIIYSLPTSHRSVALL
jgi:uncharacterized membrane protein YgdD (TMEM256/DUF423 family)